MAWPKGRPKVEKKVLVPGKLRGQQPSPPKAVSLPSWAEGGVVVGENSKFIKVKFPNGMTFAGPKE